MSEIDSVKLLLDGGVGLVSLFVLWRLSTIGARLLDQFRTAAVEANRRADAAQAQATDAVAASQMATRKLDEAAADGSRLQLRLNTALGEIERLQKSVQDYESKTALEHKRAEFELEKATRLAEDLRVSRDKLEQLRKRNEHLEHHDVEMLTENSKLHNEIDELRKVVNEQAARISELETQVTELRKAKTGELMAIVVDGEAPTEPSG